MLPPPRNIHTPDWSDAVCDDMGTTSIGPFDITSAHRTLEICESRIQRGEDPTYRHPALASAAYADSAEFVLSEREREMAERYVEICVSEATPSFWPERIWDSVDTRMGKAEEERLRDAIENSAVDAREGFGKVKSSADPKKEGVGRLKRSGRSELTMIAIDFDDYRTESDETDWEDF
jgi:hypothetical protein